MSGYPQADFDEGPKQGRSFEDVPMKSMSPIERSLADLHGSINELEKILSRLHEKLDPVLVPVLSLAEAASDTNKPEKDVVSKVANSINEAQEAIHQVCRRADKILQRLEV
jgi:uncharacterized protein YoxC